MRPVSTYAFVLAGGRGTRLDRLTDWRAKPALPFGGTFAIIDFTLSNCINSGLRRIGVLTQYEAQGLIRHVERAWGFLDADLGEYVDVVPAHQREGSGWYAGTADAVRQNLALLREAQAEQVLVLSGDHVYKMDYTRLLAEHAAHGGGATVASVAVSLEEACGFGVLGCDEAGCVISFDEKPARPRPLHGRSDRALASMGVYAFDAELLVATLEADAADAASTHDFGRDVLPRLVARGRLRAHDFAGSCVRAAGATVYWRDVGTVDAYWETSLDLTRSDAPFTLVDGRWPIRGVPHAATPALVDGSLQQTLVAPGCVIAGATVRRSVISTQVQIGADCRIEDSVLLPGVRIGAGSTVRRAVVDSGCVLSEGFRAGVYPSDDCARFPVTDRGVVLVTPALLGQPGRASLFD